jgi:hypothetical protein
MIGRDKSGIAFGKKYQAVILRIADDEDGLDKN